MGGTNYGNQLINVDFFAPADSAVVNKGFKDTRPLGIYDGGYLTVIDDVTVSVSPSVSVVGDGVNQIRVETQDTQNITVSVSTPYVVFRWAYNGAAGNYMDMLALEFADVQEFDLLVGICNFTGSVLTGFDYTERSRPMTLEKVFEVESTSPLSMRVRVKGGNINFGVQNYAVVDQLSPVFTAPVSNSRIDVVAVSGTGTIIVLPGVSAVTPVAPDYAGKSALAEITLTAGQTEIDVDSIDDVRNMYGSSSSAFILLNDTPESYAGNVNKVAKVNVTANGLDLAFVNFSELGDGAGSLTGNGGKTLMVNVAGTAVEYNFMTVLNLSDTPATYGGNPNLFLKVNAAANAVEFSSSSFLYLGDTPGTYSGQTLKYVRVTAGETGLQFVNPTLLELSDVPATYTAQAKKMLRVNAAETAVEFTPEFILENRSSDPVGAEPGRMWMRTDIV